MGQDIIRDNLSLRGREVTLTDEEYDLVQKRINNATVLEVLNIEVEILEDKKRVTIWSTKVESDDKFYDELHPEFYRRDDGNIIEVDVQ